MYTNIAAIEAANHSGDSNFWRNLYAAMEMIECHCGSINFMYDNVLSTESSMADDDSPAIAVSYTHLTLPTKRIV